MSASYIGLCMKFYNWDWNCATNDMTSTLLVPFCKNRSNFSQSKNCPETDIYLGHVVPFLLAIMISDYPFWDLQLFLTKETSLNTNSIMSASYIGLCMKFYNWDWNCATNDMTSTFQL
jgi:hypothetical protein